MNVRMLPPVAVTMQTIVVNGRTYSAAPGATVDVPDFDAFVLAQNGWARVALSGTTAQRPTTNMSGGNSEIAVRGVQYVDTTLNIVAVYDGAVWRNPLTGASV